MINSFNGGINMKLKILLIILTLPLILMAQDQVESQLNDQLGSLNRKLEIERSRVNQLQAKLMSLEGKFRSLSDSLQGQISVNLELQAQNERAVNLALDQFSKKFEEQNATMDGVKSTLEKQWSQQLFIYFGALLVFLVVLVIGVKMSNKNAIEKHQKSWNEFNEYIIKR